MLKLLIILCIHLCMSSAGLVGAYYGLVLVQQPPITSFIWQQNLQGNEYTVTNEFIDHLREHQIILKNPSWTVYGLWPIDVRDQQLSNCMTSSGIIPAYNQSTMDEDFLHDLKSLWPTLEINRTQVSLWESEYIKFGACISSSTWYYFESAKILSTRHNVGEILDLYGIVPGRSYSLESIVSAIQSALRSLIYVRCIPAQDPAQQYLLEVQICFNPLYALVNCLHGNRRPRVYNCDTNKSVYYMGLPWD